MKDILELQKILDWLLAHESDFIMLGLKKQFLQMLARIKSRIYLLESDKISNLKGGMK